MDDDDLDLDDVADLMLTYMHADGAPCPDSDHPGRCMPILTLSIGS